MITIKDVAKEANVAPSTVSRVIADNPRISEKTKKKVREVMDRLGYYPNLQARSLAAKSTQTIGVVFPNSGFNSFQNPFFPIVLQGISTVAHCKKYGMYLSTGATEAEIYEEVISMVQGKRVDGIVLLSSRTDDKTMQYLEEVDFPFTVVGRPYANEGQITYVDNDNVFITKQATKYLIDLGHENIAFIGGSKDFVVTLDRLNGFKQALAEANLQFREENVVHDIQSTDKGEEVIKSLITMESPPTALVTLDDSMAYTLISHLENLDVRVPEDISIVSFNNYMLSEHLKPPLTSVDISIFQLGYEATNCLLEKLENPNVLPKRITIPTRLIIRKSCSPNK